ncbi:MAG TPA: type IV toxin-antitoxin system AbiEi family antitoxin domain-containing protein [Solirubrobacterales bacterium]|nr:type IV toxin-antitoxin system AbiEi family antitoxin domain-containing protein [Solirubrobacterales bacterium]
MRDAELARLAGQQRNRFGYSQLVELGFTPEAIRHRLRSGRIVRRRRGVYAIAPVLEDDDGHWIELTLTAPGSFLRDRTAACALGVLDRTPPIDAIVRPGVGGPRLHDGIRVYRSATLAGETAEVRGIPVTAIERTLLDLTGVSTRAALARALREAVRLELTSLALLGDALGRFRGRRGTPRLAAALARYAGLPIEDARSGSEVLAMEILRDAGRPMPRLNHRVGGEEADLSWPELRLILEIDGGPFHLDRGEDARKQAVWEAAGFEVRRLPSDLVYEAPAALLALAPPARAGSSA